MKRAGSLILLIMGIVCFAFAGVMLFTALVNFFNAFIALPIEGVVVYFVFPDTARSIAGFGGSYLEWIIGTIDEAASTSVLNTTETILYFTKVAILILVSLDTGITCIINFGLNIVCGIIFVLAFKKQKIGLFITSMILGYIFFTNYIVLAGGVLGMIGCLNENREKKNAEEEAEKEMNAKIFPEDGVEEIEPIGAY